MSMIRNRNIRFGIYSCVSLIVVFLFFYSSQYSNEWRRKELRPFHCPIRSTHWIVVTTIFYPTKAIEKFLSLSQPWTLIVIADRKTPIDWLKHVKINGSRLIFLSVQEQRTLNYRLLNYLPYGSYARKNLGYLIAIQCGAKVIFESDDDNLLENENIYHLPKIVQAKDVPWIAFHRQRSPFVNIYASFGHPEIWPRGFPIDEFRNITEDGWHSVRKNSQANMPVYIQQFLADLDPDVDALYRLTHSMSIGRILFDRDQPPIAIEPFTFSPYNTQNTVTHYEAFWGLYLPVTTTFRVCDIWRGFWVQRLLWDIGGYLLFGTATVQQMRNSHSYLSDMKDEEQLYHQSGAFARFLSSWQSFESFLEKRIAALARDIAQAGFWRWEEVPMIDAWLADLQSVGYRFPAIVQPRKMKSKIEERRTAICVTGLAECLHEAWVPTSKNLHQRLGGSTDTFLFLSSSVRKPTVSNDIRLKQFRLYENATVTILYEDRVLDPAIPKTCHPKFQLPKFATFSVPDYFQQVWALNQCYELVKNHEKRFGIRYQILVRSRIDILPKMPSTFHRSDPFDINKTILVPPHRYFSGIDDGFAVGPIDSMSHYMTRWLNFQKCPPDENFHPETFLRAHLLRLTNISVDSTMSGAADAVPHAPNQCH